MTSIIGFTRAPCNLYCSIAPVKKLYQREPISNGNETEFGTFDTAGDDKNRNYTPNFHRIFTRESMSSAGIIDLIKNKQSLFLLSDKTAKYDKTTAEVKNYNKEKNLSPRPSNVLFQVSNTSAKRSTHQQKLSKTNYNVYLSIELESKREFDSVLDESQSNGHIASISSYTNVERVIESISELAYNLTMKFVNVLELLKKLLLYQKQYQFLSCIDKQQKTLKVYFPNDLTNDVGGTYAWLKEEVGIDISTQQNWHLVPTKDYNSNDDQQLSTANDSSATNEKSGAHFDGKAYFEDIHRFIDQVDALIQSNGLFSHPGREENQ